jgi:hypothetical protein
MKFTYSPPPISATKYNKEIEKKSTAKKAEIVIEKGK